VVKLQKEHQKVRKGGSVAANPQLAEPVPLEDLQAFKIYTDPAYEARHGIIDSVICRECGQYVGSRLIYKDGEKGHLWAQHRMLKAEYRRKFPEAPLSSLRVSAKDALRTGNVADASEYIANRAKEYATPQEIREVRRDPAYEARKQIADRFMCRICGFWANGDLSPDHLALLHIDKAKAIAKWESKGLAKEYNLLWPGAPTSTHLRRADKLNKWLRSKGKPEKTVEQVMKEYADSFVLPEELAAYRQDPKSTPAAEFAVCLVCGQKCKWELPRHVNDEHPDIGMEGHRRLYPAAPEKSLDERRATKVIQDRHIENRNARLLPPHLASKPDTWQKIVPVLIADRAVGGNISNPEVREMFGLQISTETMNDIRRYCGIPGPKGRPRKNV
jgi:hypothetical protein